MGASVGAAGSAGCKQSYHAPCTTTAPAEAALPDAIGVDASSGVLLDAPSGDGVVATWLAYAEPPALGGDAGGAEAGGDAGADGGAEPSLRTPSAAVVLAVDDLGGSSFHRYLAPSALAARRGSTQQIGAVWTGAGVVWSWVETTTATESDGTVDTTAVVRAVFVGDAGEGPMLAPAGDACSKCVYRISSASTSGGALLLVDQRAAAIAPPGGGGGAGAGAGGATGASGGTGGTGAAGAASTSPTASAPARYLATTRDGAVAGEGTLGFVPATVRASSPTVLRVIGSHPVVTAATIAWRVDDEARPIAGPYRLPTSAGVALFWGDAPDDLAFAWTSGGGGPVGALGEGTVSGTAGGASIDAAAAVSSGVGETPATGVGDEPDLLFARVGGPRPERLTTASNAAALARAGDAWGVLANGDSETVFALADANGRKIGGDVELGVDEGPTRAHALHALGPRRFVWLRLSGERLVRREIACAP